MSRATLLAIRRLPQHADFMHVCVYMFMSTTLTQISKPTSFSSDSPSVISYSPRITSFTDFTCCSSIGYRRMDKEALKQSLFDAIERLENNGLIDYHFRECYFLKEDSGPRFFFDLISSFSTDVGQVVKQMGKTLNQPIVDFSEMNELCIKLKGSAACIGACRISAVCSNLLHAIENKSKER